MEHNQTAGDSRSESTELTRAVGARVRRLRRGLGMTQIELAEAMGYRDSSSVTYIEQGRNAVKMDGLMLLCSALKTSPNELFGWDG